MTFTLFLDRLAVSGLPLSLKAYELSGDHANMRKSAAKVLELLGTKASLTELEKSLKISAERRLKE